MVEHKILVPVGNVAKSAIRQAVHSIKKYAEAEANRHRRNLIREWFQEFDSIDTVAASCSHATYSKNNRDGYTLRVETWNDPEIFGDRKSAEKWRERRRIEGDEYGIESRYYVSDLLFNQGIIGLPEYSTRLEDYNGPGWTDGHNDYFFRKTPLSDVLSQHNNWKPYTDDIKARIIELVYQNIKIE